MELWMVGLALSALLVVSARDLGRPGRASAEGLTGLRIIGGLGLGTMSVLALVYGHPAAAAVAGLGAAPLLAGLVAPVLLRRRAPRAVPERRATTVIPDPRYAAPAEERRAA